MGLDASEPIFVEVTCHSRGNRARRTGLPRRLSGLAGLPFGLCREVELAVGDAPFAVLAAIGGDEPRVGDLARGLEGPGTLGRDVLQAKLDPAPDFGGQCVSLYGAFGSEPCCTWLRYARVPQKSIEKASLRYWFP